MIIHGRVDIECICECSTLYLTSEMLSSTREDIFCIYKHTNNVIFDDFPKILYHSEDFGRFSENCPKVTKMFRNNFSTFEADLKMFRSYANKFKYSLSD